MKYLLSTAILAAAFVQPASAQQFAGPYVGVNVGIIAGTTETQDYWCDAACDAPTLKDIDLAGGVGAGFNHQIDNFVIGAEADIGMGVDDEETTEYVQYWNNNAIERYRWDVKLTWLASLRARMGLAMDRTMVYATGGFALGKAKFAVEVTDPYSDDWAARTNETRTGYVVGGGIERKMSDRMSLKAEFLHYDLGKSERACYFDVDDGDCWDDIAVDDYVVWNPTVNQIRVGLNFAF